MSKKALYEVNMTHATTRSYSRAAERARQHLSGPIVFSSASFYKEYFVEDRIHAVSSDGKVLRSNMGGYSTYASSLDDSDFCVRLEQYMAPEYGGKNSWQIERCYMMSDEVERAKAFMRTEKEHEWQRRGQARTFPHAAGAEDGGIVLASNELWGHNFA